MPSKGRVAVFLPANEHCLIAVIIGNCKRCVSTLPGALALPGGTLHWRPSQRLSH